MAKFYVPVSYDKHRRANFKLLSHTVIRIMLGHFRSFCGQDIKLHVEMFYRKNGAFSPKRTA